MTQRGEQAGRTFPQRYSVPWLLMGWEYWRTLPASQAWWSGITEAELGASQEVCWMGTGVPENWEEVKDFVFKFTKKILIYLSTVVNIIKKMGKVYCYSRRYVFQCNHLCFCEGGIWLFCWIWNWMLVYWYWVKSNTFVLVLYIIQWVRFYNIVSWSKEWVGLHIWLQSSHQSTIWPIYLIHLHS